MNERIKELAVQAGIISAEYNGFDATGLTTAQRKFAELIVFKCIDLCNETFFKNNSDADHWQESEEGRVIREYFVGEK